MSLLISITKIINQYKFLYILMNISFFFFIKAVEMIHKNKQTNKKHRADQKKNKPQELQELSNIVEDCTITRGGLRGGRTCFEPAPCLTKTSGMYYYYVWFQFLNLHIDFFLLHSSPSTDRVLSCMIYCWLFCDFTDLVSYLSSDYTSQ